MTRKFKALGLALVAVFALSAVGASGASAVDHVFKSEGDVGNVTLHGTQETANIFRVTTGTPAVECTKATFHGTQAVSPANTVTIHPEYTGCTFLGLEATIDVPASCNYVFSGATPEVNMARVAIECSHSPLDVIKVTAPGCTVEVGSTHPAGTTVNQSLNGVRYETIGAGATREVTVEATIHNIVSNVVGSFCALGGISTGTHTEGTYDGKVKVTGSVAGAHVGVTID